MTPCFNMSAAVSSQRQEPALPPAPILPHRMGLSRFARSCIMRWPCCDGRAVHAGAARRCGRRSSEGTRGRSAARCSPPAQSSPAPPARRATRGAPSKPRTCELLRAACCGPSHAPVGDRAGACMHADSLVSVTFVAVPSWAVPSAEGTAGQSSDGLVAQIASCEWAAMVPGEPSGGAFMRAGRTRR